MTRKAAIRDAEPHVVVSHGADFFGQDRHPVKSLAELVPYVENSVSYVDRKSVAPLVEQLRAPVDLAFPAAEAAELCIQLLKVSRTPRTKPAICSLARSLSDAAERAAADGEPWNWTVDPVS
ncbi:hypothetical protein GTY65_16240 [Streptomyces sp. SID8379]|uniref:DUF7739 domain-containing protein n=1 Tax=unclassified Streptomyces TaxID=2593676 RepID=UPI00036E8035|nr:MULTISPECIES: hypothetical protein [unclassified Streptomyces]MYW65595.1 hypothetical protein [Streptomyces sp. SID8379]